MEIHNATEARANFYKLIAQTVETSVPVQITSKGGDAVLVSKADWDALQETLYLANIPGLVESLHAGMNEPEEELLSADEVEW